MDDRIPGRGDRFSDDPAFANLEAAYGAFRDAWGAWMVGHHPSSPAAPAVTVEDVLVVRLVATRRTLGEALDARAGMAEATAGLAPSDAAALANIRASLRDLDAWASPLDGLDLGGRTGAEGDASGPKEPEIAALRRRVFDDWGAAMAAIDVGGERLQRLAAVERLTRLEDPEARRETF